jgi:hypothetical protein
MQHHGDRLMARSRRRPVHERLPACRPRHEGAGTRPSHLIAGPLPPTRPAHHFWKAC